MSPAELLYTGLGVLILVGQAVGAWFLLTGRASKREVGPQPFEVREASESLTRREHSLTCGHIDRRVTALETRADRLERRMDEDKKEIIASGKDSEKGIHSRINTVLEAVSELRGELKRL
jgi:hypothetical protein